MLPRRFSPPPRRTPFTLPRDAADVFHYFPRRYRCRLMLPGAHVFAAPRAAAFRLDFTIRRQAREHTMRRQRTAPRYRDACSFCCHAATRRRPPCCCRRFAQMLRRCPPRRFCFDDALRRAFASARRYREFAFLPPFFVFRVFADFFAVSPPDASRRFADAAFFSIDFLLSAPILSRATRRFAISPIFTKTPAFSSR